MQVNQDVVKEYQKVKNKKTNSKNGYIEFFYKHTGLRQEMERLTGSKDVSLGHKRGVFMADLHHNSLEFLRSEIGEKRLNPKETVLTDAELERKDAEIQDIAGRLNTQDITDNARKRLAKLLQIKAERKSQYLQFNPGEVNSIFQFWKDEYAKERFRRKEGEVPADSPLRRQSYMSVVGGDGKVMNEKEFIEITIQNRLVSD